MRKTEDGGSGTQGRFREIAAFYHPVGVCWGKALNHQPTSASKSLLRPSKNLKIENPGRIKASQDASGHRKKGRFAIGSVGFGIQIYLFLPKISAGCTLTHHRISSQNREVPVDSYTPLPASGHISKC